MALTSWFSEQDPEVSTRSENNTHMMATEGEIVSSDSQEDSAGSERVGAHALERWHWWNEFESFTQEETPDREKVAYQKNTLINESTAKTAPENWHNRRFHYSNYKYTMQEINVRPMNQAPFESENKIIVVLGIVQRLAGERSSRERSNKRPARTRSESRDSEELGHSGAREVASVVVIPNGKTADKASENDGHLQQVITDAENSTTNGAEHNLSKKTEDLPLRDDIVCVLGSRLKENREFSPPIHSHFVSIWKDILQLGLPKEAKHDIFKKYPIPSNCEFFDPPQINKEIELSVNEMCKTRDKRIAEKQDRLVAMIASLSKALSRLLSKDMEDKEVIEIIEAVSDATRLAIDNLHEETAIRRSLILSHINPAWKDTLLTTEANEFLFGKDLAEVLKTAKSVGQEFKSLSKKSSENSSKNFKTPSRPSNKPQAETFSGQTHRLSSKSQTQKPRRAFKTRSPKRTSYSSSSRNQPRYPRKH
ncbi:unnamed protein product [Trichogramma brassicae]|uniref:Uncharacterized protein n=1 Tax=Trichogramma brassicae TaxID=86971 RepID=A0A6H5IWB7_9HYME|nr:unnamed protein product [Trichogramma brassicae]